MANPIDDPYWPLIPGVLRWAVLKPFSPLSFGQLAEAFDFELLTVADLADILGHPGGTVETPSDMLRTFVRTASIFDRRRDIQEELQRLAAGEKPLRPPLWKVLATLIVRREADDQVKLYALESLFQTFGQPTELRPYTLYGDIGGKPTGVQSTVEALRTLLEQEFSRRG